MAVRRYRGAASGSLNIEVTGADWAAAATAVRRLNPEIARQLDRDIVRITRPVVQRLQAAVRGLSTSATGGSGPRTLASGSTGLRAATANSIQVSRRTSGRGAGVRIRVNPARMPAGKQALPVLMDQGSWRHPVMGNRSAWVTQTVSPSGWFTRTVTESWPWVRRAVMDATDEALQRVGRQLNAAA